MSAHTPVPWYQPYKDAPLVGGDGHLLAKCDVGYVTIDVEAANAAFIVLAANAHDALLAALHDAEWGGQEPDDDGEYFSACPVCGGGDPDHALTPDKEAGHVAGCALAAALAKAEGTV